MVLRSAAVRRNGGGAPQRITQALACLRTQPAAERLLKGTLSGDGATAGVGCLRGEWLLGLTAAGGKLDFAPLEANQVLRREGEGAGGTYERRVRGAFPTLTSVAGSFEARCRAADADKNVMLTLTDPGELLAWQCARQCAPVSNEVRRPQLGQLRGRQATKPCCAATPLFGGRWCAASSGFLHAETESAPL